MVGRQLDPGRGPMLGNDAQDAAPRGLTPESACMIGGMTPPADQLATGKNAPDHANLRGFSPQCDAAATVEVLKADPESNGPPKGGP